ncbi:MAG: PAS domain S-box protein [Symploca sp. SIO3C6]|nr:PAS domain S-box protein [Symploca sp. SIO3C6]
MLFCRINPCLLRLSGIIRLSKTIILRAIIVVLAVIIIPSRVNAQESQLEFKQLTVNQGLSQSCIFAILQDSRGFMWFGTQDGLNRYDGYRFITYKYDQDDLHSLSDNWVNSIYEDHEGFIWVGTDGLGLNKFNYETEQFTRYTDEPNNPNSLDGNRVLSIHEDKSGRLWIGTAGGGINLFNRQTEQFIHYRHDPDNPQSLSSNTILSIYEDKSGRFWLGTAGGGLNLFNRQTEQFIHYQHDPDNPRSLSSNTILSIYEDKSGRFWLGTEKGGLNLFNRQTGQFIHYQHDPDNPQSVSDNTINSIVEDSSGNLWLATSSWYGNNYGTALEKFSPESEEFTHYQHDPYNPKSLSENVIPSLWKSNSEILWIGTGFSGINKLDLKDNKFVNYQNNPENPNNLSDNHISSIYEGRDGSLWIGTFNKGLDKLNRETGEFIHYRHELNNPNSLSSNDIWSVYEDHLGNLWIGTFNAGLNKLNLKTGEFTHYLHQPNNSNSLSDDTVVSIYEDHLGILWFGTFSGGVNKFDPETGHFTHYTYNPDDPNSLSDNNIWVIYEDQEGAIWLGGYGQGGLNKFNRETEQFTRYKHDPNNSNSLSYDRIDAIHEDRSGILWIGTYGGGLNKFDKSTDKWTIYTEKEGLSNNSVIGILEDDQGNLWLSTGKGLSKFNPQTETFRNYDVSDGLQGNEFDGVKAHLQSKAGEMFFGGLNGFNSFFPEQVKDNPYIPPIVITDFKIFNESVKLDKTIAATQQIKLSYKENFFSFEFSALDYTNPQKNQYAYKLEGFDKNWINSRTRRYASYTNLDAGTYIFKVKGSNNDGVWNQQGTAITIIITPPPWKTWWAYVSYVLLLAAIVTGYVRWKIQAQERENALLRESETKLKQILEAIPIGIVVINTSGQSVYVNHTAIELLSLETAPDGFIGKISDTFQFYIAGTKQLYPSENLTISQALKGNNTTIDDIEIHHQDQVISLEARGTPIYNDQGAIIYAVCAFQDITARKQAEAESQQYTQELKQAKDQLQAVLNTVPGSVAWMSADGRYLGTNGYLAKALNLSPEAFVGQEIGFFDHTSQLSQFILEFLASPKTTNSRVVNIPIKESIRNYLIAAQKYQQNSAAVAVGIDITEQKSAEEALRKSLKEKEILLKEVHHRVKNNLQVISSLLDLQSSNLKDANTIELFRDSYNRVRSMALVHERLYSSTSLEEINFAEYIENLTSHLIQSYGLATEPIEIKLNCQEVFLNLDKAITCGLIINELISNALKYAFPHKTGGLVEIRLNCEGEQLFLSIKDNGVGLPKNLNLQVPTTLGLQLVQILTQQLEGELDLDQSQGTEFTIKFSSRET